MPVTANAKLNPYLQGLDTAMLQIYGLEHREATSGHASVRHVFTA